MTQQERTQILQWISDNEHCRDIRSKGFVYTEDLTAFIKALSTEDEQDGIYKESDYLH